MNAEQEILAALWRRAKKPSRNAATLTHNLGATFAFLETQWDDKARQIIGALVAVNASRMHTTIWAALFQQLRETSSATIKVYVLKQFANICWTVPLTQGTNAFRAFALEIRPLLSDIQIVTNVTFQKHFATIVSYLKPFAEHALTLELFHILYSSLTDWKRTDAIRAAANVIAELVLRIPHCCSAKQLLLRAKADLDFFAYAILLETVVAAGCAEDCVQDGERITFFRGEVEDALQHIVGTLAESSKAIPPCVSVYRKLRTLDSTWEPTNAAAFATRVVASLAAGNASKLLICPFLQFLQSTSFDWWQHNNAVWNLVESSDPFVRADALLALSCKVSVLDLPEILLTIDQLREKLHYFIEEKCSYSVVAVLRFLRVFIMRPEISAATRQLHLLKLLHICCRHGKGFLDDQPAQLELLNVFLAAPMVPESIQQYVARVFVESRDRNVAKKAFQALLHFSDNSTINEQAIAVGTYENVETFYDTAICATHIDGAARQTFPAISVQRCEKLNAFIFRRFLRLQVDAANDGMDCVVACDAVVQLCQSITAQEMLSQTAQQSNLTILSHLLTSQDPFSSDVYLAVLRAAKACVEHIAENACGDAGLLFLPLVQHSWSALVSAASSMYADYASSVDSPSYRFFRSNATPFHILELVGKCKDVALSNEVALYSSVFYDIVESNISLLSACIDKLSRSPLFLNELTAAVGDVLGCCDALLHCTPKYTIRLLTSIFSAFTVQLQFFGKENCQLFQKTVFYFLNHCSSLLSRSFTLNYLSYCPELCYFLRSVVQNDGATLSGAFSVLLANNWAFLTNLVGLCNEDAVFFNAHQEGKAVCSILRLFQTLCWSKYGAQVKSVVTFTLFNALLSARQTWKPFAEQQVCNQLIDEIKRIYDIEAPEMPNFLQYFSSFFSSGERSFLDNFETAIDYFNASDETAQKSFISFFSAKRTAENLVLLAALDESYIPSAIDVLFTTPVAGVILETFLLLLTESECADLRPLEFFVSDELSSEAYATIKEIVLNYRCGWFFGPRTKEMLLRSQEKNSSDSFVLFLRPLSPKVEKNVALDVDGALYKSCGKSRKYYTLPQLPPGGCAFEFLFLSRARVASTFMAEDLILSNTPHVLPLLKQIFIEQDNFADLSDPHVILFSTKYVAAMRNVDMFLWELEDWSSLLRAWVSIMLTTPPQSEQWEWLQLSCWTLFYRVYNHLFAMARTGHPKYPTESGSGYFEELRTVYLQLSHCFLGCRVKSVDEVATAVLLFALRNATFFESGRIDEEIFWCVAHTCLEALWVAMAAEKVSSVHDPEIINFFCRVQGKIGWPLHVQQEAFSLYAAHLRDYGRRGKDVDMDTQRHLLWCVGTFGTRVYLLSTAAASFSYLAAQPRGKLRGSKGRDATSPQLLSERDFTATDDFKRHAGFRNTVSQELLTMAHNALADPGKAAAAACAVDALELLRGIFLVNSTSTVALLVSGGLSEVEVAHHITRDFLAYCSPLSADAPLQPAAHCLLSLEGAFPTPRQASSFCDTYGLALVSGLLSAALASWLQRRPPLSAPPAQIPCRLAIYLPYLVRLDLPLYVAALKCLEQISMLGASDEAEAVFNVMLLRLAEDLTDLRWDSPLAVCADKVLVAALSRIAPVVQDGKEVLSRRLWEGLWRGAGSPDVCRSHEVSRTAQLGLRRLIGDLLPGSPQWDLSRLVVLSTPAQQKRAHGDAAAEQTLLGTGGAVLPFQVAADLEQSQWRAALARTQAELALRMSKDLDADSCRSLLFDFVKAAEALGDLSKSAAACQNEVQGSCLMRERVGAALLPPTEAVLAALNYFDFSELQRRRFVLRELSTMVSNDALPHPAAEMTATAWTSVYFDVLYERATCLDEGLWVACAVAAVEASGGNAAWVFAALESLIAASSTQWKRNFLLRMGKMAKRNEARDRVRSFFVAAGERLFAVRGAPSAWKTDLLAEAVQIFSA